MPIVRERKSESNNCEMQPGRPIHRRPDLSVKNCPNEKEGAEYHQKMPPSQPHWLCSPHCSSECGRSQSIDGIEPDGAPIQPQQKPGDVQDKVNDEHETSNVKRGT